MNTFDKITKSQRTLAPIDVTTVQERVYQSLRLGLLRGEFLPGEQVSIRGLAEVLGTSAMPVTLAAMDRRALKTPVRRCGTTSAKSDIHDG